MPRARIEDAAGKVGEWRSKALPRYQRLTKTAEALIASVYLSGTNTLRVKRALFALFKGAVSKDVVSRAWRKVKVDWDAWCARSLADEDIVRLILDGTVIKTRIDTKASNISVLAAIGVRRDGQKVLLSIMNMGGESTAAWRQFLADLDARGLRKPEFVIVDGAPGLEAALVELWGNELPIQRCTVHKHRNLIGHAPSHMHDDLTEDYRDMVYAETAAADEEARGFPAQVAAEMQGSRRQPGGGGGPAIHLHPPRPVAIESGTDDQCHRTTERGIPPKDQDPDRASSGRNRADAALGSARLRPDQHAQGRRLADPRHTDRAHDP